MLDTLVSLFYYINCLWTGGIPQCIHKSTESISVEDVLTNVITLILTIVIGKIKW